MSPLLVVDFEMQHELGMRAFADAWMVQLVWLRELPTLSSF